MNISTIEPLHQTTHSDLNRYDASSIRVLKDIDAVRQVPAMYIGDPEDGTGLHKLACEVIDNAVDEGLAGYCTRISVIIHQDESFSVQDNGRGIPVDMHPDEGRSAAEVILTVLHAGGKFNDSAYKISGGLHGLGVSLVNALSKKLMLTIYRDGFQYEQVYRYGKPEAPLEKVKNSKEQGTLIRFYPDPLIFKQNNKFDHDILLNRLTELAYLSKLEFHFKDERKGDDSIQLKYEGGVSAFVEDINQKKPCLLSKPFYFTGEQQGIDVEVAINWQETASKERVECFTNMTAQKEGGKHLEGFKGALTRVLNQYIEKEGFLKKLKLELIGEDFREGLITVLSIKMRDPKFNSQVKEKLVSSEARKAVEGIVFKKIESFLLENPNDAREISIKAIKAAQDREAVAKARAIRKTPLNQIADLPGKLHDCQEKDPSISELFLVEGKSAGGTVKQARSRRTQAVLPLRGKILNIERISFDKMLSSEEIATLISAMGCGVGVEYSINKLRYHRIIIMTDADVDGSHIRTLLLTFFYRQFPDLIQHGYLYIAHPPLYKIKKAKQEIYLQDDEALEKWFSDHIVQDIALYQKGKVEPILTQATLKDLIVDYRQIKRYIRLWERDYPSVCLKALSELPSFSLLEPHNLTTVQEFCQKWQAALDKRKEQDIYYKVEYYTPSVELNTEESIPIPLYLPYIREWRYSIETSYYFTLQFFGSEDYQKIVQLAQHLSNLIPENSIIKQGNHEKTIFSFYELYEWLMQEASRGYTVQRYKGLGEMDWEELLPVVNPETRQLSRVTIDDAREADRMVTILMGSIVDDRRQFIEQNALEVVDIDV